MVMSSAKDPGSPELIDFSRHLNGFLPRNIWKLIQPAAAPFLGIPQVNAIYREVVARTGASEDFFLSVLDTMGIRIEVDEADLDRIPAEGPLATVSNHPFGGIDGVVLGAVVRRRRQDLKILGNYLLNQIEPMRPHLINVDPFGGVDAPKTNLRPMRESIQWLKSGGVLGLFPAGTVSHLHLRKRQVTDPVWVANMGSIIRRTQASVLPIYFEGRNSNFFQISGLVHPMLRTLLLVRELVARRGQTIRVRIGSPIKPSRLERFEDTASMMGFLRLKTYILQNRNVAEKVSFRRGRRMRPENKFDSVIPALSPDVLQEEIDRLSDSHLLASQGSYRVYFARAKQIPNLLREIGRLREITFRKVGEGTGMSCDLDGFDPYYLHLFMWNVEKRELVGAYRLGATDEILNEVGRNGLYTTTLFRYRPGVIERLNPALELGRSFIVEEYQRKHISLGLIWRGIGEFVVRNPRYRILFGPVSISKEYQSLSKNLIVMYLKENTLDPDLSDQVKAKRPPRSRYFGRLDRRSFAANVRDIEDVSALISEIEREERGVPVLLKQYLKLNATMLSFNVDPDFNDCIDGLVLVDLVKTNEKTLRRYMGDEGVESFYAYHETRLSERASLSTLQ